MSDPGQQIIPSISDAEKNQYNSAGIMTIEWQTVMILAWLNPYVSSLNGYVKCMASPKHLWEEIYTLPENNSPRVLVCFNGEIARGKFADSNKLWRVDRNWIIAILRGHGFNNTMAQGIGQPNTPGSVDPFYKFCQIIRDKCRQLINITEEYPIDYKGMEPIPAIAPYGQTGNVFLDAYAIRFSTANDIPEISAANLTP